MKPAKTSPAQNDTRPPRPSGTSPPTELPDLLPDPESVWECWSTLITGLLARGVTKAALSRLSGLPLSTGRFRQMARYVLYPRTEDWVRARLQPLETGRAHHLRRCALPWTSQRAAVDLVMSMHAMTQPEVATDHPEIAEAAGSALAGVEWIDPADPLRPIISPERQEIRHAA